MRADRLLPLILGSALGLGGILQGLHWRNLATDASFGDAQTRLAALEQELEILRRENESLRSLAQGGGELAVPPELVARIEKEFDLSFLSSPVVHRVPQEVLEERVGAALDIRFGPGGLDERQRAYSLIGWLSANDSLRGQLVATRTAGARAWFDDVSGEAWVTERHDPQSVPDQAALLRVLARILLHQHFPPPAAYPGDDPWRAREAVHQGAAAGAEARYFAANARAIGFLPMNNEGSDGARLLQSLPPFLQGLTTFPAIEGKGYADTRFVSGAREVHEMLKTPPAGTFAILFPADTASAAPPALPATPGDALLEESAGALGIRLFLAPLEDPALAEECAKAWRGDRYRCFASEPGEHLVWFARFATPEAAIRFATAARDLAAANAGLEETPAAATFETPEKRFVLIDQPQPELVRFLHAADRQTLESVPPSPR